MKVWPYDDPGDVRGVLVDDITDKEVSRRLDLSDLPPDGHSLAIAIAAGWGASVWVRRCLAGLERRGSKASTATTWAM